MWVTQAKQTKPLTYESPTMAGGSTEENSLFTSEWDHSLWYCCVSATWCHHLSSCRLVLKARGRGGWELLLWARLSIPGSAFIVLWEAQFFAHISHPKPVSYFLSVPIFLLHFLLCECDLTQEKHNKSAIASLIRLVSCLTLLHPYSNHSETAFS